MRLRFFRSILINVRILAIVLTLMLIPITGCSSQGAISQEGAVGVKSSLKLQSTVFKEGERIPDEYTCDGKNISPPLSWSGPDNTLNSWVLIVEDPDAPRGIFTHWIIYNIPANITSLPEAVPTTEKTPNGALQGKNDSLKLGYTGPCPPPGPVHHYDFTLYALDSPLNLPAGVSKKQLLEAMQGHIISQGKLTGIYQR
jgi:Raf kinase inhibitor-like YbhB/YbcL family protein